jgi:hypothetical protein
VRRHRRLKTHFKNSRNEEAIVDRLLAADTEDRLRAAPAPSPRSPARPGEAPLAHVLAVMRRRPLACSEAITPPHLIRRPRPHPVARAAG